MSSQTFVPGPTENTVRDSEGQIHTPPANWSLLPPGDAAMTRRVKAAGEHWIVQEKKGRRTFSKGIWAPAATIEKIAADLKVERSTESYAKRKVADKQRRDRNQSAYVDEFYQTVVSYLDFHPKHATISARMARAITDHATP
ncbi:hypothetical protein RMSM_00318, partial [Rhodopirellula maiorica SM1]